MRVARLDGIRALAILLVLLFHHSFGFGWEGVDLFFVLSGFLITNILRKSRAHRNYWSRFYIKRAARIMPPLVPLFAAVVLISAGWSPLGLLGYGLFVGNILNLTHLSIPLLQPMWSLAVEEHFYLLWPSAVRRLSDSVLLRVILGILIAEPILRAVVTPHLHSFEILYESTPLRLDGLAAGALLALALDHAGAKARLKRWSGPAFLAVGAGYVASIVLIPNFHRESNSILFNALGYSLVTAMSFLLVAFVALSESGTISAVLAWRPVTYFGRISYGVYLYSMFITSIVKHALHIAFGPAGSAATRRIFLPDLILTVAVCAVSFHFLEQPVLRWAEERTRRQASNIPDERTATASMEMPTREPAHPDLAS